MERMKLQFSKSPPLVRSEPSRGPPWMPVAKEEKGDAGAKGPAVTFKWGWRRVFEMIGGR